MSKSKKNIPLGKKYAGSGADSGERQFTPDHFQFEDKTELLRFIERFPLAQLITHSQGEMYCSATPMIQGTSNSQNEVSFLGHLAKRNVQVKTLDEKGCSALALFVGPQAYVSPRWFKVKNTVPTWNYISVQVRGRLYRVDGQKEIHEILQKTIEIQEKSISKKEEDIWTLDTAPQELVESLSKMIVGLRFVVESIDGVKRLCQDKDLLDIRSISDGLQKCVQPQASDVAALMTEYRT